MSEATPPPASTASQATPNKLKEDNKKLKNLVKLAKARIEEADKENARLREEIKKFEESGSSSGSSGGAAVVATDGDGSATTPSRIIARIRVDEEGSATSASGEGGEEWVLFEYRKEITPENDYEPPSYSYETRCQSFPSPSALQDYVLSLSPLSGDKLVLPSYSLSPAQSYEVERESREAVKHVTEEFRRYRVRNEISMKQKEMKIDAISETTNAREQSAINGGINGGGMGANDKEVEKELREGKESKRRVGELEMELVEQETQWKEAYDTLLKENEILKTNRAESMLASKWRLRYEQMLREKEDVAAKLENAIAMGEGRGGGGRGSQGDDNMAKKYQEIRDEYKLYRKKAKEIFEEMKANNGGGNNGVGGIGGGGGGGGSGQAHPSANDRMHYLKNIMLTYLSSEDEVKSRMESAIAMALNFSESDKLNIAKKKKEIAAKSSWL